MGVSLTCPECCGPKDTPITYTFCWRCSEAKAGTPNPLRAIIDERDELRARIAAALPHIEAAPPSRQSAAAMRILQNEPEARHEGS